MSIQKPPPSSTPPPASARPTLWLWLLFAIAIAALLWGVTSQLTAQLDKQREGKPFLQVTNRELSLFLWQEPQFMRVNARNKSGYLPAFNYADKVTVDPRQAEAIAIAPPEVLFRYHVWDRLLRSAFSVRPIPEHEFAEFLEQEPQWQPDFWPEAPATYRELIVQLDPLSNEDLSTRPALPRAVQRAFQGWKNYRYEGEAIRTVRPTYKQMADFLTEFPQYERHHWRNIANASGKHLYLKGLTFDTQGLDQPMAEDQLAPFLQVGFYNAQQADKN